MLTVCVIKLQRIEKEILVFPNIPDQIQEVGSYGKKNIQCLKRENRQRLVERQLFIKKKGWEIIVRDVWDEKKIQSNILYITSPWKKYQGKNSHDEQLCYSREISTGHFLSPSWFLCSSGVLLKVMDISYI